MLEACGHETTGLLDCAYRKCQRVRICHRINNIRTIFCGPVADEDRHVRWSLPSIAIMLAKSKGLTRPRRSTWSALPAITVTQPRPLNAVLAESLDRDGLEKTIALYNELRSKYYGGAQYDFGETPLNLFTESLLAKRKYAEALAIMELNFSANHPDSVWSYHMLAMTHQANGQIDKAIGDYRRVLELHPDDTWAKQQIETLSKNK